MTTPVNHGPTPVLNLLGVGLPSPTRCANLKAKYNIVARQHKSGAKKSSRKESHHILQDKAMVKIISKYKGFAVLLSAAKGGIHDQINAKQVARNCPGPGPATFGALTKASRDDLKDVFRDNGMPAKDAKDLANCLTMEAVNETFAKRKTRNKRKLPLGPNTPVSQVKGCFGRETLIRLASGLAICVDKLETGMLLWNGRAVRRTDSCTSELLRIETRGGTARLTPAHRVRLASGEHTRADRIIPGHRVATAKGARIVTRVVCEPRAEQVFSFDFTLPSALAVGEIELWVELPVLGPPVRASVKPVREACAGIVRQGGVSRAASH